MGRVLGAFLWLRARVNEPSTHAALSGVCASVGFQYPGDQVGQWMTVLSIAFGVVGFFLKEQGPLTKV